MIKNIPRKGCIVPCDLTGLENMGVRLFFLLTIWSLCIRASLMSRMQKQNFITSFLVAIPANVFQHRRHDLMNVSIVKVIAITVDFYLMDI